MKEYRKFPRFEFPKGWMHAHLMTEGRVEFYWAEDIEPGDYHIQTSERGIGLVVIERSEPLEHDDGRIYTVYATKLWTQEEIDRAKASAEQYAKDFGWNADVEEKEG